MKAKKTIKITILALLALIAAVLVNTCLYVFVGQQRSVEKNYPKEVFIIDIK